MKFEKDLFELFCYWFRNIKCYGVYKDWTDEQIDLSMNADDIKEFVEYCTEILK